MFNRKILQSIVTDGLVSQWIVISHTVKRQPIITLILRSTALFCMQNSIFQTSESL